MSKRKLKSPKIFDEIIRQKNKRADSFNRKFYLSEYELDELNVYIVSKAEDDRLNRINGSYFQHLLPPIKYPEPVHFGDFVFGMMLVNSE